MLYRLNTERARVVLPFLVFFLLIVVLYASVTLSSRRPTIESVSPTTAGVSEVVTIRGRHFGATRGEGRVRIGGRYLPNAAYSSWSDTEIRLRTPVDLGSGLLYVATVHGSSEGVLFTSRQDIPVLEAQQGNTPNAPRIVTQGGFQARVGELLVIPGRRFGLHRGESEIIFRFAGIHGVRELSAGTDDRDYELWTDREIRVRVPDGVSDGVLYLSTDRGMSEAVELRVPRPVGEKQFEQAVQFRFRQLLSVAYPTTRPDHGSSNTLFLYQPVPTQSAAQASSLLERSHEPFAQYHDLGVFRFENLSPTDEFVIEQDFEVLRYPVRTEIRTAAVPFQYRMPAHFLSEYRSPDPFVPSAAEEIVAAARSAVGNQRNPHLRAGLLLTALRNRLSYDGTFTGASAADALIAWQQRGANAFAYASLYTALLRAAEVPARMQSGFLVRDSGGVVRHFWVEYYLQDFGWVPVDPALVDGYRPDGFSLESDGERDAAQFYFGNLDGRRVSFSDGLVRRRPRRPDSVLGVEFAHQLYSLQTVYHERIGNLTGYVLRRPEIELVP